jgi:predicted AAA+ superfamily ATPase
MALSNHERVQKVMDVLRDGLRPFLEREMKSALGPEWLDTLVDPRGNGRVRVAAEAPTDVQMILKTIAEHWTDVFGRVLGRSDRSLVFELQDTRNRWAHQQNFSSDDAYRAMDSAHRLLAAVAAQEATELDRQKQEFLRQRYDERARNKGTRASTPPVEGKPEVGLLPWRQVVTPHPDVATGRFQQAEFAADLAQVQRNEGSDEYRVPREFFTRTFLTDGLRRLLINGLKRLSGTGGDPVVELQTNFGGGKTHSMLALYHLVSGAKATELPGLDDVFREVGLKEPPKARRAVLVGTAMSPGQPSKKPDGTLVRTMWGEMAWQLGGKEGYALVAKADETGTSPGDALDTVFKKFAPCLILIDEWVAYARQLFGKDDLPAGTFDTHFTFAQALTEAAKRVPKVQVVLSIPASDERTDEKGRRVLVSDIEIGGEGGRAALERLKNVVGRMQSPWRPASMRESFEIVRRRLFQPLEKKEAFQARDAVIRAFLDMYRTQAAEFPVDTQDADYRAKFEAAYPIHPELFERLYTDWGSLERFQRTRGVLRLMAAVIHALWEEQDGGLAILPSMVPIHRPAVQDELTRYLEDNWRPVLERDIDGSHSVSLALDREKPNLGRYSACRRVARAVYIGSAPNLKASTRGIEEKRVRLACVQPGESTAIFGDALRALSERANHLYIDGARYWFSPQPSVARLAEERAQQFSEDDVHEEILVRLRTQAKQRGDFAAVYAAPESGDVPDEREARLVLLGPSHAHGKNQGDSSARRHAQVILDGRGSAPRIFRNALVFSAPDMARLAELDAATRRFRAWKSIEGDKRTLNLDEFQKSQAEAKTKDWDLTCDQRVLETWVWLLVPVAQRDAPVGTPLEWQETRLSKGEAIAPAASRKLRADGHLQLQLGYTNLRLELDRVPLWQGDCVSLKQLVDFFAQYLYLPRLKGPAVLLEAIAQGVLSAGGRDGFAYAESFDEYEKRYRGLVAGAVVKLSLDSGGLVVRPEVAQRQLETESLGMVVHTPNGQTDGPAKHVGIDNGKGNSAVRSPAPPAPLRHFRGSVMLNPIRMGGDAGRVAEEVVQHMTGLVGARVTVTLEIHVDIPGGIPEKVRSIVNENCKALKFGSGEFEE